MCIRDRARSAAISIIPTTTGAAKSIGKIMKHLEGKLDGISLRVPTPVVSIVDFIGILKNGTTAKEVNKVFEEASQNGLSGILGAERNELVSADFKGDPRSAIVD